MLWGSSVELVCKRDPKQFPEPLSSDNVLFDTCFVSCLEGVTTAINTGNIFIYKLQHNSILISKHDVMMLIANEQNEWSVKYGNDF